MKCEPPRSPLGDVIVSKLYLFTASDDTFKREKKSHPEEVSKQITLSGTSGGRRYKHRHTDTHTQIYIDVNVEANIFNERYLKNGLCLSSSILVQMPSQETMLYLTLRKVFKSWALVYWAPNSLFQSPGVNR